MSDRAFVFAPDPILTVTVEAGGDGDEIHLHAGGQGFWLAQMMGALRLGAAAAGLNITRRGLATGERREIERLAEHIEVAEIGRERGREKTGSRP